MKGGVASKGPVEQLVAALPPSLALSGRGVAKMKP
jgi:hypothetical protein